MRKLLIRFLGISLILTSVSSTLIAAPIRLRINHSYITPIVAPVEQNGTTLVPLRVVSENLGASVNWEHSTKAITITKGKTEIRLYIGNKNVSVNGVSEQLTVAPQSIQQTTMVPIRFISEKLNCNVQWENGIVNIISNDETSLNEEVTCKFDARRTKAKLMLLLCMIVTKKDVDISLETNPTKVINAKDTNKSCWRYELSKEDGYKYEGEESKYDSLDIQGMKDGRLNAVVFCEFDDNDILTHYTLYYVEDNNKIIEIRDGEQSVILTNLN